MADTNRANKLATTENLAPNYANQADLATKTTQSTPSSPTVATNTVNDATTTVVDESAVQSLALRLQNELRRAKSQHLACTEVLLPSDLLNRIASELIVMSEKEPCGIRGSIIYIEFEDEPNNTRFVLFFNFLFSCLKLKLFFLRERAHISERIDKIIIIFYAMFTKAIGFVYFIVFLQIYRFNNILAVFIP